MALPAPGEGRQSDPFVVTEHINHKQIGTPQTLSGSVWAVCWRHARVREPDRLA